MNGPEVRLPVLLVVADSSATGGRALLPLLQQAVAGGARGVWVREKGAAPTARLRLIAQLSDLLHSVGGVLVASPGPGSELADGEHWPSASAPGQGGDGPSRRAGRSCHSPAELARAAAEGFAWATLSPIYASASKPGYGPPLGPSSLCGAPLPTWALGGVDEANAAVCTRAGAAGVAVMGAVLGAADPGGAVASLLASLAEAGELVP